MASKIISSDNTQWRSALPINLRYLTIRVVSLERRDVSNHWYFDCLFNTSFMLKQNITSRFYITGSLWETILKHQVGLFHLNALTWQNNCINTKLRFITLCWKSKKELVFGHDIVCYHLCFKFVLSIEHHNCSDILKMKYIPHTIKNYHHHVTLTHFIQRMLSFLSVASR